MTMIKHIILGALAVAAPIAIAAPAHAQVSGVATADPIAAMYRSKAWTAASAQINETFKAQQAQIEAKAGERQRLLATLDKNGDKQVDEQEMAAAPAATKAQLDKLEGEMNQLNLPIILAKGFAIDRILERYSEAQQNVVTARKVGIVVTPQALLFATDAADITGAITTELDRIVPTVSTQPVPNRRPSDEALQILEQFLRADAARAAQARQAAAPRPTGAAPAAGTPAAGTRPPAVAPAKPTTPPPGR